MDPTVCGVLTEDRNDGYVLLESSQSATHVVLFLGIPLHESVIFGGPFIMNSREEIRQAQRDFAAGRMGHLMASA